MSPAIASPERAPVYSTRDVFFCCAEGILQKGQQPGRTLTEDDTETMLAMDRALHARGRLRAAWDARLQAGQPSLALSIASFGAHSFAMASALHFCEILVQFISPPLIRSIVNFIDEGSTDVGRGVLLAVGFFLTPLIQSIMQSNFVAHCRRLGLRNLSAASCMVFEKVLRLSQPAASNYGPGALLNIMQVDTQRFDQSFFHLNFIWSMPLMLFIGVGLLYNNLGLAAFTPLLIKGAMFPLNNFLVRRVMRMSRERSKASDARIKVLTEVLHAVRLVKMLAWEERIADIVREKRANELAMIATQKKFEIVNGLVWQGVPVLLPLATFGVFTLLGGRLHPALVFSSLALLDMIRIPMNLFPQALQVLVQVKVGVDRIEKLLLAEEMETARVDSGTPADAEGSPPVHVRCPAGDNDAVLFQRASYRWSDVDASQGQGQVQGQPENGAPRRRCCGARVGFQEGSGARPLLGAETASSPGVSLVEVEVPRPPTLRVLGLRIPEGKLALVSGPVGAGKSTLVAGILNEVPMTAGHARVRGPIAFCSQLPWILQGTVRDNIVLEEEYDASRFAEVAKACAIEPDLKEMRERDMTVIGERGINLSGGQKARIALARAAYKYPTASTYILDDPLAAVDVHVASHLMDKCLDSRTGLLRGKTRVLVTHQLQFLDRADLLVVVKGGEIVASRHPSEFCASDFEALGLQVPQNKAMQPSEEPSPMVSEPTGELAPPLPPLTLLRSISDPQENSAVAPKEGMDGVKLWPEAWEHTDSSLDSNVLGRARLPPVRSIGFTRAVSADDSITASARLPPWPPMLHRMLSEPVTPLESESARAREPLALPARLPEADRPDQPNGPEVVAQPVPGPAVPEPAAGGRARHEEERQVGALSLHVWLTYARAMGPRVAGCLIAAYFATNLTMLGQTFWLAHWASSMQSGPQPPAETRHTLVLPPAEAMSGASLLWQPLAVRAPSQAWTQSDQDDGSPFFYLLVYAALSFCTFSLLFSRMLVFRRTSLKVSRALHEEALWAVIRSPMSWLDTTPTGRTVNRFSQDMTKLDLEMQGTVSAFADNIVVLSISVTVISVFVPILLLLMIPLLYFYNKVQRKFRLTVRELQRLASVHKSPVFQGLDQAIAGVSSIRAFEVEDFFIKENARKVETAVRMIFNIICCNRWLAIRLRTLGTLPVALVTLSLCLRGWLTKVTGLSFGAAVEGGTVGLVLRYALQLTTNMEGLLQSLTNTELCLVALERLSDLSHLELEPPLRNDQDEAKYARWPPCGQISFQCVTMRYREDLPTVLNGISFTIPGGTSVGVVGRTGAGKSSLLQALFRMCPLDSGSIIIDGVDIGELGLHTLRRRLAIIPQDPVGFTGALRFNLDPFNERTDDQIMEQLRNVQLHDFASEEGLQHHLTSGGENLSVGQRQLVCAARAFLRGCRILVLDEATASVDFKTDGLIQDVLRNEVVTNRLTTVTIAHRINTILGSDNVLVMDSGRAAEFGPPRELADDPSTIFHGLAKP